MTIRVLIADDHAVIRDGLRLLLEAHADIRVVGMAANGRDAVRLAASERPDVAVFDIAMPELNGIEAAEQLRQTCPGAQVVILSMHASREHILRALQAGARGYLLKETAGDEVAAAVRAVHEGRRYLSQKIADAVIEDFTSGIRAASPLDSLTAREREVFQLIAEGKSSAEVAAALSLSPKTVVTYRSRIMQKLGLDDLAALIKFAIQHGLISLE